MKLEVSKAFKRRMAIQRKREEKQSLAPAAAQQPKSRAIRYDNVRSAMAEEGVLRLVLREESLLDELRALRPEMFSSPLLGRAYALLQAQRARGGLVSLAALEGDFSAEEMAHLTAVSQKKGGALVREDALRDCVSIIREEATKREARSGQDLMALRNRLKEKKGLDG